MSEQVSTQDKAVREEAALLPPVDVIEDAGGITLYADLPGVSKEALQIHVEGETLTLEGPLTLSAPAGMEATHVEVDVPRYRRVFTLSKELDSAEMSASFQHGVLTLRIPKAAHAQPRKIAIEVV
ncbi:Hsp20/alpha crystallin family protein [Zoogloeaceae bacteirum Par-f-2]|jgi:HSP20 family molecular chaperone IbpA|uniref:Hsp20/alpha crystallin family protein n=1 Tax=Pseudothauera hydrothermalis TaxID=2184083 RepID=UPI000C7DF50C|nr:Hsp20/alpha crystallin family protein [Pseudothauera hydrothermalis]AUL99833.1 heat-shock protein [Rhodocyclaceae bacterium]AVZ79038.1 Hsp20/alpha crystallin family protein [Zoogloeaceae bacteirum Par-f-2]